MLLTDIAPDLGQRQNLLASHDVRKHVTSQPHKGSVGYGHTRRIGLAFVPWRSRITLRRLAA